MSDVSKVPVKLPRGRQRQWDAMCAYTKDNGQFTIRDICRVSRAEIPTVREYVRSLVAGDFAEVKNGSRKGRWTYALIRMPRFAPRLKRDGTPATVQDGQDRMWRSMKMNKRFCASDLVETASTPDRPIKLSAAKSYIQALKKGSYFIVRDPGGPNQQAVYTLKDSMKGAEAPQILRVENFIYDPNKDEIFPKPLEAIEETRQ